MRLPIQRQLKIQTSRKFFSRILIELCLRIQQPEHAESQAVAFCIPIINLTAKRQARNTNRKHAFNDETRVNCPSDGIFTFRSAASK